MTKGKITNMKTNPTRIGIRMSAFMAAISLLAISCNKESAGSEGSARLKISFDKGSYFATKALDENSYKNTDNYQVTLTSGKNDKVLMDCKGSEINDNLPKRLEIGNYVVKAWYGKEEAASRNDFYVVGEKTIKLDPDEEKEVSLTCQPTCGKVVVNFGSDMPTYYKDYSVTYGGTSALGDKTVVWEKNDTDPWYLLVDEEGETVNFTLHVEIQDKYKIKDKDGNIKESADYTGSFKLERNKVRSLNITPNYTPETGGGMSIHVTIDDSTNERPISIEVPVTWI